MKIKLLGLAAVSVVLLSGCAGAPESASSPTATTPPADGGTYSTVADLKDAYVAAGGDCPSFSQGNEVKLAAESGECGTNTVLSTYVSNSDVSQVIQNAKTFWEKLDLTDDSTWLVGQNWIINSHQSADVRGKLGGKLVSFGK